MMTDGGLFIADYQHVSLIEYPGSISSIIFTHGCNLRCRYCHNPSLVTGRKSADRSHDFFEYLEGKDIEAVAVTGGEPLVSSGLADFLMRLKEMGLKVKLDTNGFMPDRLKKICEKGLVDYVALDLKAFNETDMRYITRADVSEKDFFRSLDILRNCMPKFEVRHTLWKNPEKMDIERFAKAAGGIRFYVQKLRTIKMLDKTFVPTLCMDEAENIVRRIMPETIFR